MFTRLLIANRGEIACRILRTARRMGLHTIAVYSQADADALHARSADEAACIGPASARESYLNIPNVIAAARAHGAQAIHPGYGFLSESAAFAQACVDAGLVWVGPPAAAIEAMGSKSAAKSLLTAAGVPLTPGYHGADQDPGLLAREAARIGYPVLIKASAGGGGKGMRRVDAPGDFPAALAACQREALGAFGSDQVLVEKYILQPRHIEIQVFADTQGNVIHLFERDCSVQRRHQKVLEEAPAPGLTPQRRAAMGAAAIQVAHAVSYVGAGTVEFIVPSAADDDAFYFMEMNTRLQVEHPVTEMITGLDLVEWQLRVAAGEPLPCRQEQLAVHGHAIEARLYAEDADHGFTPASGCLEVFSAPPLSEHVRLDAGVAQGDRISPHYDPMIAKLIAWGPDRETARVRLHEALVRTHIVGLVNNLAFLGRLVQTASFAQARLDTDLIERERAALAPEPAEPAAQTWLLAALAQGALEERKAREAGVAAAAWGHQDAWRLNLPAQRVLALRWQGQQGSVSKTVDIQHFPDKPGADTVLRLGSFTQACHARVTWAPHTSASSVGQMQARIGMASCSATVVQHGDQWHVFTDTGHTLFACHDPLAGGEREAEDGPAASLLAPMPGKVLALLVAPGSNVVRDTPLLILEAMKMEHTIRAPQAGTLSAFRVAVGDQVAMGEQLLDFAGEAGRDSAGSLA